jgi:hypothetical protein
MTALKRYCRWLLCAYPASYRPALVRMRRQAVL